MKQCALTAVVAWILAGVCTAQIVEEFESVSWPSAPWTLASGAGGSTTDPGAAHDGARGWIGTGGWYLDPTTSLVPGDKLSVWVRTSPGGGAGRFYFCFNATGGGAQSLVFAPNTNDIRFQNNAGWGFQELNLTPFVENQGQWYRLELEVVTVTDFVGRIFDTDGTTELASVSQTFGTALDPNNGIAIRSFGAGHGDTIEFIGGGGGPGAPASSPASLIALLVGLIVALGVATKRAS